MENRRRVLELVASGTISVEDGERLLEAIGEPPPQRSDRGDPDALESAEDHLQRAIGTAISTAIESSIGRGLRSRGRGRRVGSVDDIVSLASHGVKADFVRDVSDVLGDISTDDLVSLASMGIRADFVRDVHESLPEASADELVALASMGVRPDFVREMKGLFGEVSSDDLMSLASMGVRPEYVREIRDVMGDITIDEAVSLKSVGVDAAFVRELAGAGVEDLSTDSVLRRRFAEDA